MKKLLAACLCIGLTFSMSGCSLGQLIDKVSSLTNPKEEPVTESKPRVYMDEMKGHVSSFNGNLLEINYNDEFYTFDISQASVECSDGIIIGEEVSLIYEGQIPEGSTDTSSVEALKVVDDYHNKQPLTENTLSGKLQDLSENKLTVSCSDGTTALFPITGREIYFKNGIHKDSPVFIHYYGELNPVSSENPNLLSGSNLKVMTISDVDPYAPPSAPAIPKGKKASMVHARIDDIDLNKLTIIVDDSTSSLTLDMSSIPCFFPGGVVQGAYLNFIFGGNFDGSTTNDIEMYCILGDNQKNIKPKEPTFQITGTVLAKTANTITLRTSDDVTITVNIDGSKNTTTGGLEIGDGVRGYFNPFENRNTNIYSCFQLEDAY